MKTDLKFRALEICILLCFAVTFVLRVVLINYYDSSLGGIEQNVVYGIQRLLAGQHLYQDTASGSYGIIQYTPLWYHLVAAIARSASAGSYHHGLDVQSIYVLCRTLALVCNILTIIIGAVIIRNFGISWVRSFIFSLPLLVILTAHFYTRGDSLYFLLFTASICCYLLYVQQKGITYMFLCALVSAACIMTKQSGILLPIIVCASLALIQRKFFAAFFYLLSMLAVAFAIARICIGSDGYFFYQNAVLGLRNGFDVSWLADIFTSRFFLDLVPCYACGIMLLSDHKNQSKAYRILLVGMLCSWLFAAVTGLKVGSSNNYFTEFLFFFLVAAPVYLHTAHVKRVVVRLRNTSVTTGSLIAISLAILLLSKTTGLISAVYIQKSLVNDKLEYEREQQLFSYCLNTMQLRAGQHIFFTERRYLDNIFAPYTVMPDKDVISQVYTANPKTFNYQNFGKGVNAGMVSYIVTDERRDDINVCNNSLPFIWFDKSRYKMMAHVSGYVIYVWAPGGKM